jgi:hypothetical protein
MLQLHRPQEAWSMKARVVLIQGQAQAIEASAEAWKLEAERADAVRDLEVLVEVGIALHGAIRAHLTELWQRFRASPRTFPAQQIGGKMLSAFASTLHAFEMLESGIRMVEGMEHRVEGAADFRITHRELIALHESFVRRWPMVDPAAVERGRAEIAVGRFKTLDEVTRDLDCSPRG